MSDFQKKIYIFLFFTIGILYLITKQYSHTQNLEMSRLNRESTDRATEEATRANEESAKSYRNKEIKDYLSCNLGSSACSRLYPEGSKAVNEAKRYGQENRED